MSRVIKSLLILMAVLVLPAAAAHAQPAARQTAGTTINVKIDAGAKGDGVTDDSRAFETALSELRPTGGTLIVPSGTYLVDPSPSAYITIPSNVTVQGDDATLKAAGYGFNLLEVSGSHISLAGITVDGDNKVVRGITVDGSPTAVMIEHSIVENVKQPTDPSVSGYADNELQVAAGIRIEGNGDRITIESTTVKNVTAVNYDPSPGSGSPTPVARGIWITPASNEATSKNITIKNSQISDVSPKDDGDCLVIQGNTTDANTNTNLTVTSNVFDHCAKRAVKIQLPGATVANNLIINPFLNDNPYIVPGNLITFDMYSAISVYASNVTVSHNMIGGVGSFYNGIEIGASGSLSQIRIDHNTVEMGPNSNISAPSSSVRAFVPVDHLVIEHNILDNANYGIRLDAPVTNATIVKNQTNQITHPLQCVSGC